MPEVQPRTSARRRPIVLGGIIIASGLVAIAFASKHPDFSERTTSYKEIPSTPQAAGTATAVIEDAVVVQTPATQRAPIVADAAVQTSTTLTVNDLAAACRGYAVDRKWSELEQCAEKLKPLDPNRAAELRTRAVEETRSQPHIAAVKAALHDNNLKRAGTELDQVWTESVDYANLKRSYDTAETQEIDTLATQLESLKDDTCEAYNQLLTKERPAQPPRVTAAAARRIPCAPSTKCDADALSNQGRDQFVASRLAEALASYEAAFACRPAPDLILKAFVVSCNLRNATKARLYWKRLSIESRSPALATCERNEITEAMLNAP
jgi:tetratricopeptide (TPR) repeat protein